MIPQTQVKIGERFRYLEDGCVVEVIDVQPSHKTIVIIDPGTRDLHIGSIYETGEGWPLGYDNWKRVPPKSEKFNSLYEKLNRP